MEFAESPTNIFDKERLNDSDHFVAMNFKVSFEFRQAMKVYAATNGLSMKELLINGFELVAREEESLPHIDNESGAREKPGNRENNHPALEMRSVI